MPKRRVNVPSSGRVAELDIVSYGRRGRHTPLQFTSAQIEQVERTARGVPEVMIKVSGGKNAEAVRAHLAYIDRHGKLEVHTDDGQQFQGKAVAAFLVDDWNLDVAKGQYQLASKAGEKDRRPKQVYNVVFSMPAGTPPEKLLSATQKFAREKFALQHRYAMVLHTDQQHPHVHLVLKAVSEQGERLYIRKATLRQWREDFASYLRELGVPANATPTALRGKPKTWKQDGIYRALKRGQSTFMRLKAESVAEELRRGQLAPEAGRTLLLATRARVVEDWKATAAVLQVHGQKNLAGDVEAFIGKMPAVATEKEALAKGLLTQLTVQRARRRGAERDPSISDPVR